MDDYTVYKIDRKKLKFPRECYSGWLHRMFGILSPSRCMYAITGGFGWDVSEAYTRAHIEWLRVSVNKRTATKEDYKFLRQYERRHKKSEEVLSCL